MTENENFKFTSQWMLLSFQEAVCECVYYGWIRKHVGFICIKLWGVSLLVYANTFMIESC